MNNNNSKQGQDKNAENKVISSIKEKYAAKAQTAWKAQSASQAQSASKAQSAAKDFVDDSTFKADPLGCYTGHSKDARETPTQDVDDL